MTRRLMQADHQMVVYDLNAEVMRTLAGEGAVAAEGLADLVKRLKPPRSIWLMLPAGEVVEKTIKQLAGHMEAGDLIIDGGNSHFKDDQRRSQTLAERSIYYMDAGVSGGVWGLKVGYCTMVGGRREDFDRIEPIFKALAPPDGYLYCGPVGAGHYVKMVHNGIEYALMQAYGEGFELLRASQYGEQFDLGAIAHLWNQGSVVRSWLLELLADALKREPQLESLQGYVEDSGEGRWTVLEAVDQGVAATSIAHALFSRFLSRQQDAFSNKVLAALRREFGGHAVAAQGEQARTEGAGAGKYHHSKGEDGKVS